MRDCHSGSRRQRSRTRETTGHATGQARGTYPFTFDILLEDAKRRAAAPYAPQRSTEPSALDKLSPEQYRSIHFNPDAGIWRAEKLPFRLELLRAAPNLPTVTVSTVEDGHGQRCGGHAGDVSDVRGQTGPVRAKYRCRCRDSGFAAASTRIRSGTNFWCSKAPATFAPSPKIFCTGCRRAALPSTPANRRAKSFRCSRIFGSSGPARKPTPSSSTHCWRANPPPAPTRFTAQPGVETLTDVELTLFPRAEMRVLGIAPLTSMFLFDETNRGHLDDYRPEVHDSDGLQITTKSGEHLFRPLANPLKLQVSSFTTQVPQGFGLVQRSRQQSDFEDFDAQYERRPSAWITPKGDWGPGAVELVEIPSGRETNDNIVAFWRPAAPLLPGHPAQFAYTISWCAEPPLPKGLGKIVATRSGASIDRKRRVFVLDIVGAGEKLDGLRLDLSASAGAISNSALVSNGELHGLRASFEIDPKDADLIEMRLRIMRGDTPVSETWLYRWTSS